VKFLVDESLSSTLSWLLNEAGHDALHVGDLDLLGASDDAVMAAADTTGCVLVSADTDFGELLALGRAARSERGHPPEGAAPPGAPGPAAAARSARRRERAHARRSRDLDARRHPGPSPSDRSRRTMSRDGRARNRTLRLDHPWCAHWVHRGAASNTHAPAPAERPQRCDQHKRPEPAPAGTTRHPDGRTANAVWALKPIRGSNPRASALMS
jgi:hypothetical protein